jgi:hypothetical protein
LVDKEREMFYLLNSLYSKVWNKRIVCDKELLDSYKERGNDYFGESEIEIYQNPTKKLELHIVGKCKDGSKYIYANEGIVELQSENVIDLIEEGDLVKLDKTLNQVITILKEGKKTIFEIGDNKWFSFKEINNYLNNNRLAIYKPNPKGDYIKVWEKED